MLEENDVFESLTAWTPTVGICGLDIYTHDLIPAWHESLLVTALRGRSLYVAKLTPNR